MLGILLVPVPVLLLPAPGTLPSASVAVPASFLVFSPKPQTLDQGSRMSILSDELSLDVADPGSNRQVSFIVCQKFGGDLV